MSLEMDWSANPFSAEGKRRSLEEYRERREEEEAEEARQRRMCQCANPVPGYKKMGQTPCVVCRRWIPEVEA